MVPAASIEMNTGDFGGVGIRIVILIIKAGKVRGYASTGLQSSLSVVAAAPGKVGQRTPGGAITVKNLH